VTSGGYKTDKLYYIDLGKLVCIVVLLQAGNPRKCGSIPGKGMRFLFSKAFRPAQGPTQHPIQQVPGSLRSWLKRPWRDLSRSFGVEVKMKVKGQLSLPTPWRRIWQVQVYLHSFLSSALDGGDWAVSRPGHFVPPPLSVRRMSPVAQYGDKPSHPHMPLRRGVSWSTGLRKRSGYLCCIRINSRAEVGRCCQLLEVFRITRK
jgi:hypothetical protein